MADLRGKNQCGRSRVSMTERKEEDEFRKEGPGKSQGGWEVYGLVFFLFLLEFLAVPFGIWDLSSLTRVSKLCSLHWKGRVLTTGPPGKF